MVAQGGAGVLGPEQATGLQDRHHSSTKVSNPLGSAGGMMLKPSAAPLVEPLLDRVGDLLGGAAEGAVPAAAAEAADQLADGELLAASQVTMSV